jgi:hypothetical protein
MVIHTLFERHRSMSTVSRILGVSQIRVREALVQYERNEMRDAGIRPPSLKEMQRGDVTPRFGVPRAEFGGRPAKHVQLKRMPTSTARERGTPATDIMTLPVPSGGVLRLIVTAVEPDARIHTGFLMNLQAYAAAVGAQLLVVRTGSVATKADLATEYGGHVVEQTVVVEGLVEIATDERIPARLSRPFDTVRHRNSARWTIFPAAVVQLETLQRIRADGLRVHLTTGAMSLPANGGPRSRRELGAVIVEITAGGAAHCRHLLAPPDGDGTFHDLDTRVAQGVVRSGNRVEAITFGDVHHAHLDRSVAIATWGVGAKSGRGTSALIDRLRPRHMVFHDVCDFEARNAHDARDHHKRFAQMVAGTGDVGVELAATAAFLGDTRRDWSTSVVVGSNHDEALLRWLREQDFREDPRNAIFFLQASLDLHQWIARGEGADGFFERTLRRLHEDGLKGVRFLRPGESLKLAGCEASIHGHLGADGRPGDVRFFERLGIKATLGHTHRPVTRDGIYCAGVCNADLAYARGPITGWAVGHVVTYPTGARQHLLFDGGAFHG